MIGALAYGARTLSEPRHAADAARAAEFVWQRLRAADGSLLRRYRDGESAFAGQLDDHAYFARGCLELFLATHEPVWLERGAQVTDVMLERFWDDTDGAFFESPVDGSAMDAGGVLPRLRDTFDGAELAGNSVAAEVLWRLGTLLERSDWVERARRTFAHHARRLASAPWAMPRMIAAMERGAAEPGHVVIVGPRERDDTRALLGVAESRLRADDDVVVVDDANRAALAKLAPFAAALPMRAGSCDGVCLCGPFLPAAGADTGRVGVTAGCLKGSLGDMMRALRGLVGNLSGTLTAAALGMLLLATALPAQAQPGGEATPAAETLVQATAAPVTIAAGGRAIVKLHVVIRDGWHVNANPPALEYNIPTTIEITPASGLTPGRPSYPAGRQEKFEFETTPMLVYDGAVDVSVPLAAAANATSATLSGTVDFQSCNNQVCLAPAKVSFTVQVTVAGVADAASSAAADTAAVANVTATGQRDDGTFTTSAPVGAAASAVAKSQLEQALARGGLGWFLALFVGGLLLNLTPCVFPMLGITVSIFGARRQEPLPKVVTTAVLYVLGICVMYTFLGVAAAMTGQLFGSALQNAWVPIVLGAIMLVMSLGMFGLFEMQPPAWLMDKLGGAQATSFVGAFLSGLGVGIIAAPCVGPFVVAVLAVIAQKHDVGFGATTMFMLSLGLGFPYLFLATFSNLLQALPRSGDWMVWVKHLFGTIMAAFGLYLVSIGLVPDLTPWVLPVALGVGGLWLGFIDHSAGKKGAFRMFTRVAGAIALFAGVVIGTEMYMAAARTMTFKPYDPAAVAASVAAGRPVMLDFSADWCVPCHELELNTFSDERVVAAAKQFDRYHVDLTKYDAPESEASRKQYGITGVPTVVFLGPGGTEIADARVEGFMPPEPFLGQMRKGGGK